LNDISCNKNYCEINTKHLKVPKQIVVKDRNESVKESVKDNVKDGIDDNKTTVVLKKDYKSDFTKARSNKKEREKRVDYILNSM